MHYHPNAQLYYRMQTIPRPEAVEDINAVCIRELQQSTDGWHTLHAHQTEVWDSFNERVPMLVVCIVN